MKGPGPTKLLRQNSISIMSLLTKNINQFSMSCSLVVEPKSKQVFKAYSSLFASVLQEQKQQFADQK